VDHINSCCNVVHTKESYAEAVRIIQSEPPFTLRKVPSFVCFNQNRMFPDYIIWNPCVIRIIKSGLHQNLLAGGLHHTEHVCQLFWSCVKSRKRVFTRFFDCIKCRYTLCNHSFPINSLQTTPFLTTFSPTLSSSSFYNHGFPSLTFHRNKPLWKFSRIV